MDEWAVWTRAARLLQPQDRLIGARLQQIRQSDFRIPDPDKGTYGLKGESERAAAELAEARRLSSDLDAAYSSIALLRATRNSMPPKVRALYEATFDAGLRKAGIPEE